MKSLSLAFSAMVLIALFFLPTIHQRASASSKDNVETLRKLEAEFMNSAAQNGSAGYLAYYADDAVEVPNGVPLIRGKSNIAKTIRFLDNKDNRLVWAPIGGDISGDLGYTYGTYEFHSKDKNGNPAVQYGKYTSIWKKQKDGKWKVVLDMGNASPKA